MRKIPFVLLLLLASIPEEIHQITKIPWFQIWFEGSPNSPKQRARWANI